jgi:hypothetical protein
MREIRNAYRILVGKPLAYGKRRSRILRNRWEVKVKQGKIIPVLN